MIPESFFIPVQTRLRRFVSPMVSGLTWALFVPQVSKPKKGESSLRTLNSIICTHFQNDISQNQQNY